MSDDVVAELDRWLGQWDSGYFAGAPSLETIPLVQRARDEIVALREIAARPSQELHALIKERDEARDEIVGLRGLLEHSDRTVITAVAVATPAIRDAALEEAARLCERVPGDPQHGDFFAAAIRALKDKGHD